MARRIFVKPAIGLAVWLPARGRKILPEGETVAVDTFVARCIAEGSLVEAVKAKAARPVEVAKNVKHKGDK